MCLWYGEEKAERRLFSTGTVRHIGDNLLTPFALWHAYYGAFSSPWPGVCDSLLWNDYIYHMPPASPAI